MKAVERGTGNTRMVGVLNSLGSVGGTEAKGGDGAVRVMHA